MASSMMGFPSRQSVSPVLALRRPTAAAISPAATRLISSRLLACIRSKRPIRSFVPRVALKTYEPDSMAPEYTRK